MSGGTHVSCESSIFITIGQAAGCRLSDFNIIPPTNYFWLNPVLVIGSGATYST